MAQLVTIKELEEKYGWGFVVFKNVSDLSSFPTEGEYVFHSQKKSECWSWVDDTNSGHIGIYPFGTNPKYSNMAPALSTLFVVNEDPEDYSKEK